MAERAILKHTTLQAIAAAIRAKTGKTGKLLPSAMAAEIQGISTGIDTSDATAEAADVRSGKIFYAGGAQKTGSMPDVAAATPSITVSSDGLITAKTTQSEGYVPSSTKSATKQLTTQDAQTITPGTTDQTIPSGRYLTGAQTIKGDANFLEENIKYGVTMFGKTGSYREYNYSNLYQVSLVSSTKVKCTLLGNPLKDFVYACLQFFDGDGNGFVFFANGLSLSRQTGNNGFCFASYGTVWGGIKAEIADDGMSLTFDVSGAGTFTSVGNYPSGFVLSED